MTAKETETRGGEDAADSLRIDNADVRESHIQRIGELRANRYENKVREALNRLNRITAFSEYDNNNNNNNNGINNSNNEKTVTAMLGGGGGRRLVPAGDIIPRIY